jgi:hypothetical protein
MPLLFQHIAKKTHSRDNDLSRLYELVSLLQVTLLLASCSHGVGDYDPETWLFQVGSCDQIVTGTPGVLENFIIVANGSEEEGVWPDPQPKRFPYN